MIKQPELRMQFSKGVELRAKGDEELPVIWGYAACYGVPTIIYGAYVEIIEPGYFDDALADPKLDCRALDNHDPNLRLARLKPSKPVTTLDLRSDLTPHEKAPHGGLLFAFQAPNTTRGRDIAEDVRNGNVDGCSFRHYVAEDKWIGTMEGLPVRRLIRCAAIEDICLATFPMYEQASAQLRSDPRSNVMTPEQYVEMAKNHMTTPLDVMRSKIRLAELD